MANILQVHVSYLFIINQIFNNNLINIFVQLIFLKGEGLWKQSLAAYNPAMLCA